MASSKFVYRHPYIHVNMYEQALVCLSNREIVDASRGSTFHCKMTNNSIITVLFSNCVGLIYLAI